jgi:uncharacterized membrane protein (DUF373 family)
VAEDVVYIAIAALLFVGAGALLVHAALGLRNLGEGVEPVVLELLDTLLLVFILVELLFTVRATLEKRDIVAEPFLIVGIIASIKEIVVLSVEAADQISGEKGGLKAFDKSLQEIAVLGVLVLLLSFASWLLRRKEREPTEGDSDDEASDGSAPAPGADGERSAARDRG